MTLSELGEIWCVGTQVVICIPKEFHPIACMASQKWAFKYFAFCHFSLRVIIQSIITWAFFNVLRNGFVTDVMYYTYHMLAHML